MVKFVKAYIKSMRLYYSFVTGIAGWLGVSFYEYLAKNTYDPVRVVPTTGKKGMILMLLFLSWGINQIFNDYLGRKEDRAHGTKVWVNRDI